MNHSDKKIFCFDYDNTVFSHKQKRIPPRTLSAIHALKERGHLIIMSTGRDLSDPSTVEYERQIAADAAVYCNGLRIVAGEDVLYEHFFDGELLKSAMEYADAHGLILGAVTPDAVYFTHDTALRDNEYFKYGLRRRFCPFRDIYEKKVNALCYLGERKQIAQLAGACPGIHYYMFAGGGGADVLDLEVSKADGIERLLAHYKRQWKDVVAFGDSTNDIEMLRRAGCGIAMGNAAQEVKNAADLVTGDIEEDGLCEAVARRYLHNF